MKSYVVVAAHCRASLICFQCSLSPGRFVYTATSFKVPNDLEVGDYCLESAE